MKARIVWQIFTSLVLVVIVAVALWVISGERPKYEGKSERLLRGMVNSDLGRLQRLLLYQDENADLFDRQIRLRFLTSGKVLVVKTGTSLTFYYKDICGKVFDAQGSEVESTVLKGGKAYSGSIAPDGSVSFDSLGFLRTGEKVETEEGGQ